MKICLIQLENAAGLQYIIMGQKHPSFFTSRVGKCGMGNNFAWVQSKSLRVGKYATSEDTLSYCLKQHLPSGATKDCCRAIRIYILYHTSGDRKLHLHIQLWHSILHNNDTLLHTVEVTLLKWKCDCCPSAGYSNLSLSLVWRSNV